MICLLRHLVMASLCALVTLPLSADTSVGQPAQATEAAVEARLRQHLEFLAGEQCEGRGVNTKGIHLAADHIAQAFKKAGLKPPSGAENYFQPFTMSSGRAILDKANALKFTDSSGKIIDVALGKAGFQVVGMGGSGQLTDVGIVFVGYGITSDTAKYDDYKDVDVSGKLVLMLRRTPKPGETKDRFDGEQNERHAALQSKLLNADIHKAVGVIFVNDAHTARTQDDLMPFEYTATAPSPAKLPAVHIHRDQADQLLKASHLGSLTDIEQAIDKTLQPKSALLKGWKVTLQTSVKRPMVETKNVIGVLEGAGPLAKETVVIGAHYDHLGYGGAGSLAKKKEKAIHYGADDNGSGTVALLELARRFGAWKDRQGRRLVFIAFSGEESGLLGSAYYVRHPLYPLTDTVAMINMDMVGRLRTDEKDPQKREVLTVYGTGTAKTFDGLIESLNKKAGFKLNKVAGGTGPSDHTSFYLQKIPVLFFFTGTHREYHTPADRVETINFAGIRRIVDLVFATVSELAGVNDRPLYVKVKGGDIGPTRMNIPRLGFMPGNYDDTEEKGVLVEGVSDGGPAEKAGIKKGDYIVEVGGKPVKNMVGYMTAIGAQKKGVPFEVAVMRDGKKIVLKVTAQ